MTGVEPFLGRRIGIALGRAVVRAFRLTVGQKTRDPVSRAGGTWRRAWSNSTLASQGSSFGSTPPLTQAHTTNSFRPNRDHLTRHGDYAELFASTRKETERRFASPGSADVRCGIWKDNRLIGHVTLVHGEPPRWGLGFWISEDASGRVLMTASLTALLAYARSEHGASEVLRGSPTATIGVRLSWAGSVSCWSLTSRPTPATGWCWLEALATPDRTTAG